MQDIDLISELRKNPNQGMEHLIDQYAGLVYCIIVRIKTSSWLE